MYYVKSKINGGEIKIEINDKTVFTCCVECGKEIPVDIVEEIKSNPDFDLYGTGRFCNQKCVDEYNPPWDK
jgi:hypothetical protein